jgi:RpiR family carbohydrate utilization transcriptional regulator
VTEKVSTPPLDGILDRIRYRPVGANTIEARIALAILEDPERVARESITSFARRISVSTGSVVRFAKLMGVGGYQELKLALAEARGSGRTTQPAAGQTSRFRVYMDEQIRATLLAAEEIEPQNIDRVAIALANAERVDIVAMGASVAVATALQFSLTLLGLHVRFLPDPAEQGAAAAFIGRGDVLIAVSYSGRTRAIVDAATRAAAAGATVVSLTCSPRSLLARNSTINIVMDAGKGKFRSEWPSRTAMTAVARALTLSVADQMPADELRRRRLTWTSGRFGIRYENTDPVT